MARRARRGFNMIELVVVMAITTLLAGLLLPALGELRDSAHKIVSASNLRQIGLAMMMYVNDDAKDSLPYAAQLWNQDAYWEPRELSAANVGQLYDERYDIVESGWTGMGLLWKNHYIRTPDVFYCPSHTGDHHVERYRSAWYEPDGEIIYTNYHYAGDLDWRSEKKVRSINRGADIVLATDSLRSVQDLNHDDGMNVLRGDGTVNWMKDRFELIRGILPFSDTMPVSEEYLDIWSLIEEPR